MKQINIKRQLYIIENSLSFASVTPQNIQHISKNIDKYISIVGNHTSDFIIISIFKTINDNNISSVHLMLIKPCTP